MIRLVAVIIGGSSGIGRGLVLKYAKEGYAVVFTGRNEERMVEVEKCLILMHFARSSLVYGF